MKKLFLPLVIAISPIASEVSYAQDIESASSVLPQISQMESSLNAAANADSIELQQIKNILGEQGVLFVKSIMTHSRLYAFFAVLNANDSTASTTLEYVALMNELHHANQSLERMLIASENTNRLVTDIALKMSGESTVVPVY